MQFHVGLEFKVWFKPCRTVLANISSVNHQLHFRIWVLKRTIPFWSKYTQSVIPSCPHYSTNLMLQSWSKSYLIWCSCPSISLGNRLDWFFGKRLVQPLRPDFVRGHVLLHIRFLCKGTPTHNTLKGFLTRVATQVLLHVKVLGKLFAAVLTLKLWTNQVT